VEKISKKKGKCISLKEIEALLSHTKDETLTRPQLYKIIHAAKNKGLLVSLKKDIYVICED
jgi:hypothetical protein